MSNNILNPDLKTRETDDTGPTRDFIYCARCSSVIGHLSDKTEVNGSFDHHCTNPHGIDFHLGCFSQALGCAISGQRMAADSWFPGFRWRIASCEQCQSHLGWYFDRRDTEFFYGLILNRIQYE